MSSEESRYFFIIFYKKVLTQPISGDIIISAGEESLKERSQIGGRKNER